MHLDVEERLRIQCTGQERAFQNNMSKVTDVRGLGEVLLGEDTQGPVGNEVLKEGWVQVVKIIPFPPPHPVLSTLCVQFNLILLIISIFQNWDWEAQGLASGASIPTRIAWALTLILNDVLPPICHAEKSGLVHDAHGI